jgi:hypothetical protein
LCQTHHRQLLTFGETRPIRPHRPRTIGKVKYGGLRLTPGCAEQLERHAQAEGLSESAAIAGVLEAWHASSPRSK